MSTVQGLGFQFSFIILLLPLTFSGFSGKDFNRWKELRVIVEEGGSPNSPELKKSKVLQIPVNLNNEKQLQEAVDEGHQPRRLNPVDVAHTAIISLVDKEMEYGNLKLITEKKTEAFVETIEGKRYRISLKRMVRPDGIWTATRIEEED